MAEFEGFDLVRRGYDRAAVDAYLAALGAGAAVGAPVFAVVGPGDDPPQRDARDERLAPPGRGGGGAGGLRHPTVVEHDWPVVRLGAAG
ncbi:hypothetical protein, partial [Kitasatospora sp. NPDC059571]|uniref:hypothetical protein n=1 Tax=Kitasatospora sp. NPDC059571 TaxID=3346871 RepID=UPI003674CE29